MTLTATDTLVKKMAIVQEIKTEEFEQEEDDDDAVETDFRHGSIMKVSVSF